MAERVYFRKSVPRTPVYLASGTPVTFETVDNVNGFRGFENPKVIEELRRAIRAERGGLTEITAAEYEEQFVKKKASAKPISPSWREEFRGPTPIPTFIPASEQKNVVILAGTEPPEDNPMVV